MALKSSVTFRAQTTGRINDLLDDEDEPCAKTQNFLNYLVGALLNYRDEGIELVPSILFCDDVNAVLRSFPGSKFHKIGKESLEVLSGPKVLKDCAPLSSKNWSIYIERIDHREINYGVFTYTRLPTTIPLQQGIVLDPNTFCMLIRRIGPYTVEIRGAKGSIYSFVFSTTREELKEDSSVQEFANDCCSSIEDSDWKRSFVSYLFGLIEETLSSSHGTILVCKADPDLKRVGEIGDAVPIDPALDFGAAFIDYQTLGSAAAILNLQRSEELLRGFMSCDGMILFDAKGRVCAYRMFFRPSAETTAKLPKVVGGARRRAYEGVKQLVGEHLVSVLFRSQDGLLMRHGAE